MKQAVFLLLAIIIFAANVHQAKAAELRTVIRIVSGDTIIVDTSGGEKGEAVRLIGVLAPTDEKYADAARDALNALLLGEEVDLLIDSANASVSHKDRFGRRLAYVYRAADNLFINQTMVARGHCYYSNSNAPKFGTQFFNDQGNAKKNKSGLWQDIDASPIERGQLVNIPYVEPEFSFKPEYNTADLRLQAKWFAKADPRVNVYNNAFQAILLSKVLQDEAIIKGQETALARARKNLAESLTEYFQQGKVALRVVTEGGQSEVLKFLGAGMDQKDADDFTKVAFNRELFAVLEFKEVIFADVDETKFSYTYKVE